MTEHDKKILGLGSKECWVFLLYVATEICAAWNYQPWEDEGRSWMIARSNGLSTMLFHVLRYEGHPALWYLILWGPSHWHIPFLLMTRIGTLLGTAAVYVLLRSSPFPFPVRAVLPFGFWLAFQYSVVFRSYVLFPLLGFLVVTLYRSRVQRPIWLGGTLALLANVSVHGTLVAIGFASAYGWRLWKAQRVERMTENTCRELRIASAIFASAVVFVAICVWPPHDLQWPFTPTFHRLFPAKKQAVSLTPRVVSPTVGGVHLLLTDWASSSDPAKSTSIVLPDGDNHSAAARIAYILGYSVSPSLTLALILEALVLLILYRRQKLELSLPLLLLAVFFGAVYAKDWHVGLFWVTLLLVTWAAWDEAGSEADPIIYKCLSWMLFLVGLMQISWTISTIRYVQNHSTYPSEALAKYLKTLPSGKTIDGNVLAFTVYPYFDHAVFVDHGDGRFSSPSMDPKNEPVAEMIRYGTDEIILREDSVKPEEAFLLSSAGYREGHRFCGGIYFPQNPPVEPICLVVFEK